MDTKQIIKYAAMALAAYVVYQQIIKPMLESSPETPTDTTGKGTGTGTGTGAGAGTQVGSANPSANTGTNTTPAIPDNPVNQYLVPVARGTSQTDSDLLTRLKQLAGVPELDVNGWNYYMREMNPNAVVSDLAEVGVISGAKMSPQTYLTKRAEAGLSSSYIPATRQSNEGGTREDRGSMRGVSGGYFIQ